jgi:hypothetical protein
MAAQYGERHVLLIGNLFVLGMFVFFYALSQLILNFSKGEWMNITILFAFSILLMAGGLTNFFRLKKRQKQREELKMNGLQLSGHVQAIKTNKQIRKEKRGNPPFRTSTKYEKYYTVIVEAEDRITGSATDRIFYSDYLFRDPSSYITIGQSMRVFVNTNKPGIYYVDLSFLPPEVR